MSSKVFWEVSVSEVREAFGGQDIPVREFMDFWYSLTQDEKTLLRKEVLAG